MKRLLEESFGSIRLILSDLKALGLQGVNLSEKNLALLSLWGREKSSASFEALLQKISLCNHCMPSVVERGKFFLPSSKKIRVLFLGAMPEAEGKAMEGEAETLLRKIIKAMALGPDSVYIGCCAMCRISEEDFEKNILPCRTFLKNLIALLQPEILCALGEKAGNFLMRTKEPLSRIRGRFLAFESTPLMITHHPSELLLHPELKRNTWEDVKKMMAHLEKSR